MSTAEPIKNLAIADGAGECFVGRWIATINAPCFSLAGLVLLSADQLPLAASGLPTGLDWQLLDSLQVSWL